MLPGQIQHGFSAGTVANVDVELVGRYFALDLGTSVDMGIAGPVE